MSNKTNINIGVPADLLEELDKYWPGKYSNRTTCIVEAVREKLQREKEASS